MPSGSSPMAISSTVTPQIHPPKTPIRPRCHSPPPLPLNIHRLESRLPATPPPSHRQRKTLPPLIIPFVRRRGKRILKPRLRHHRGNGGRKAPQDPRLDSRPTRPANALDRRIAKLRLLRGRRHDSRMVKLPPALHHENLPHLLRNTTTLKIRLPSRGPAKLHMGRTAPTTLAPPPLF
jgi:hypothetical protein